MVVLSVPASHGAPPQPTLQAQAAQSAQAPRARSRQLREMEARIRLMQEQMHRFRQSGNAEQRSTLLREHMQTMLGTMLMMREMGGQMMYGTMGEGGMGGGMMGQGMRGQGMRAGANTRATPRLQRRWMQDRLDIMQMMMEQMMDQMQAMEAMGMGGSGRGGK